jgi:hypothetical protein
MGAAEAEAEEEAAAEEAEAEEAEIRSPGPDTVQVVAAEDHRHPRLRIRWPSRRERDLTTASRASCITQSLWRESHLERLCEGDGAKS